MLALCISVADEPRISPKFLMRHSATGELVHVDTEAVPHFGYLPQDMIGVSVFDFFHPEDMQYLKEVYMTGETSTTLNQNLYSTAGNILAWNLQIFVLI